jgi:hypothetical protein
MISRTSPASSTSSPAKILPWLRDANAGAGRGKVYDPKAHFRSSRRTFDSNFKIGSNFSARFWIACARHHTRPSDGKECFARGTLCLIISELPAWYRFINIFCILIQTFANSNLIFGDLALFDGLPDHLNLLGRLPQNSFFLQTVGQSQNRTQEQPQHHPLLHFLILP